MLCKDFIHSIIRFSSCIFLSKYYYGSKLMTSACIKAVVISFRKMIDEMKHKMNVGVLAIVPGFSRG